MSVESVKKALEELRGKICLAYDQGDNRLSNMAFWSVDLETVLSTLGSLQRENDELKRDRYDLAYAITGGEDATGLLDSTPTSEIVEIAQHAHRSHSADIDRAMAAEAEVKRLSAPVTIACRCTKIEQDETCPVGYPSLLCETCDGKGVLPYVELDGPELWEIVFGVNDDVAGEITDEQYDQIAKAINDVFISPLRSRSALSAQVQDVAEGWQVASNSGSVLIYCLKQDGWRKGEPVMVNDIMIRVENANRSSNELQPIVDAIMRALPAAPSKQEANNVTSQ